MLLCVFCVSVFRVGNFWVFFGEFCMKMHFGCCFCCWVFCLDCCCFLLLVVLFVCFCCCCFFPRSMRCSSVVEHPLMVLCAILSVGMVHIKEPLLLIRTSNPCGSSSGFPLSLSGPNICFLHLSFYQTSFYSYFH